MLFFIDALSVCNNINKNTTPTTTTSTTTTTTITNNNRDGDIEIWQWSNSCLVIFYNRLRGDACRGLILPLSGSVGLSGHFQFAARC